MDATRPEPERPSPEASASDEGVAPGLRCPYCKGALADGALAGACVSCGTLHHIACFAEHGGCSTHACGATHARPGKVGELLRPPVTFEGRRCAACKLGLGSDAMVARCDACNTVLHAHCYESLGTCLPGASGACRGSVELMPHAEAVARQQLRGATALMVISALVTVPFAALTLAALDDDRGAAAVFFAGAVTGVVLFLVGLALRRAAIRSTPGRSRAPRGPGPTKD